MWGPRVATACTVGLQVHSGDNQSHDIRQAAAQADNELEREIHDTITARQHTTEEYLENSSLHLRGSPICLLASNQTKVPTYKCNLSTTMTNLYSSSASVDRQRTAPLFLSCSRLYAHHVPNNSKPSSGRRACPSPRLWVQYTPTGWQSPPQSYQPL